MLLLSDAIAFADIIVAHKYYRGNTLARWLGLFKTPKAIEIC